MCRGRGDGSNASLCESASETLVLKGKRVEVKKSCLLRGRGAKLPRRSAREGVPLGPTSLEGLLFSCLLCFFFFLNLLTSFFYLLLDLSVSLKSLLVMRSLTT